MNAKEGGIKPPSFALNRCFRVYLSVQAVSYQTVNMPYWWQYDHGLSASHNLVESNTVQSRPLM